MTAQSRTDLAAAVAVILTGGFFLWQASRIHTPKYQTAAEALVGPALVPTIIAALIVALGVLQAISALSHRGAATAVGEDSGAEPSEFADWSWGMLARLAAVVATGFAYVWLLSATGYLISTALILALMMVLFGNRPTPGLAVTVAAGAIAYYYLFIRLMGVYDPGGWLISLG